MPTAESAKPFIIKGYNQNDIVVTGLCIEPALVNKADDSFNNRVERIKSNKNLTGALYSSGAEPKIHIDMLINMIISMKNSDHNLIVFAKNEGRFHNKLKNLKLLLDQYNPIKKNKSSSPSPSLPLLFASFTS